MAYYYGVGHFNYSWKWWKIVDEKKFYEPVDKTWRRYQNKRLVLCATLSVGFCFVQKRWLWVFIFLFDFKFFNESINIFDIVFEHIYTYWLWVSNTFFCRGFHSAYSYISVLSFVWLDVAFKIHCLAFFFSFVKNSEVLLLSPYTHMLPDVFCWPSINSWMLEGYFSFLFEYLTAKEKNYFMYTLYGNIIKQIRVFEVNSGYNCCYWWWVLLSFIISSRFIQGA